MNVGHGHVTPREDGMVARCGGPAICPKCARELAESDGRPGFVLERQDMTFVGELPTKEMAQAALNDIIAGRLDGGLWPTRDSGEDC